WFFLPRGERLALEWKYRERCWRSKRLALAGGPPRPHPQGDVADIPADRRAVASKPAVARSAELPAQPLRLHDRDRPALAADEPLPLVSAQPFVHALAGRPDHARQLGLRDVRRGRAVRAPPLALRLGQLQERARQAGGDVEEGGVLDQP